MALAERKASVVWTGDAVQGSGTVTLDSSGMGGEFPSLPTRTGEAEGGSTPEDLIAGAHAGCYAMALSNHLAGQGNPPERLDANAEVTLDKAGDGLVVTRSNLTVTGQVQGLDDDQFVQAAQEAEQACPVSNALRGNVEINLDASLTS